ncbi:hypothetical protein XENOCAPTIV_009899 [Xenoophorus captivus]|uniref:G-protein coupled receptors family 1 profile domain-containing protein n=1 Tax=Xenoophorus captivus TaxID=1517983 RepID=A0ABV0SEC6_9TELE
MAFNDILGNCLLAPRVMSDILKPPSERLISYYEGVVQAFLSHMFGTTTQTVLMIMAFDRYVAICNHLRYSAIMTNKMLLKLTVTAWGVPFVLVGVLLGLTVRLSRCRTAITFLFCDNASLLKLSCESVVINHIYGLTFTVVLSIASVVLIYTKIPVVCLTSQNKSLYSTALQTCSTHLIVYIIMFTSGKVSIMLHRFPQPRRRNWPLFYITSFPATSIPSSMVFVFCHSLLQLAQLLVSGYMKSSISTIERRYGLSSQKSGILAAFNEVGNTVLIIFVSFFGSRVHRPRYIGGGALLACLASLLMAMPHFLSGKYTYTDQISCLCIVSSSSSSNQTCQEHGNSTQEVVYPLLLLGQLLLGIGAVPIQPFGISYIDDYASRTNSPLYLGRRQKINPQSLNSII